MNWAKVATYLEAAAGTADYDVTQYAGEWQFLLLTLSRAIHAGIEETGS